MTLGEIIKNYREEHGLSQRNFAQKTGLTNGYISMLENNRNPKNGQPITPSIPTLMRLAKIMGITLHELLNKCDDMTVTLSDDDEIKLYRSFDDEGIQLYLALDDVDRAETRGAMRQMLKAEKYSKS